MIVILQRRNQSDYLSCPWWQRWQWKEQGFKQLHPLPPPHSCEGGAELGAGGGELGHGCGPGSGAWGGLSVMPVLSARWGGCEWCQDPRPPVCLQVPLDSAWELRSSRTASEASERCCTREQDTVLGAHRGPTERRAGEGMSLSHTSPGQRNLPSWALLPLSAHPSC